MRERYDRGFPAAAAVNRLYQGDNLAIMEALAPEFAGRVDLVYIDPPYASGVDYVSSPNEGAAMSREAYRDTWAGGVAEYLAMLRPRLAAIRDLLAPTGSVFVHVGWQVNAHVRLLLDDLFGADRLVDEIVWRYQTSGGAPGAALIKNHATIFHYASSDRWTFNQLREPWPERTLRKWQRDADGRIYRVQNRYGKRYYIDPAGKRIDDVWEFTLASRSHERTAYPTQKPEALLDRIIRMASDPGNLVADFFCGSGTTLAAAEKAGRRWIGCDAGELAIQTTRRRLLGLPCRTPFELHTAPRLGLSLQAEIARQDGGHVLHVTAASLDEWAVDWDFDGDVFRPHFWAFKTRRERELATCSPLHEGRVGEIRVRAVDVSGQEAVWSPAPAWR